MQIEVSSSELQLIHMVIESVRHLLSQEKKAVDNILGTENLLLSRADHVENLEKQIAELDALYLKLPDDCML